MSILQQWKEFLFRHKLLNMNYFFYLLCYGNADIEICQFATPVLCRDRETVWIPCFLKRTMPAGVIGFPAENFSPDLPLAFSNGCFIWLFTSKAQKSPDQKETKKFLINQCARRPHVVGCFYLDTVICSFFISL